MTLIELKNFINNKIVPSDFMIFVNKDCPFLASQYVKALGELSVGGITKINSIYEPLQSSIMLLAAPTETLNVLYTDTFDERSEDYTQFENTIVVCDQISKDIAKNVEKYVIKFPKLTDWQLFDYAKTICPVIDNEDLQWLVKATDCDIDRVINELAKVSLFSKAAQYGKREKETIRKRTFYEHLLFYCSWRHTGPGCQIIHGLADAGGDLFR